MAKTDGRYEFDKVDYDTEVEATLNQISNNFQTIDDRLGKRGRVTKTLPVGTTVQTFDRAGILDVRMRGRTLVNLLGKADVTRFSQHQGSTTEDNTVSYNKPVYKFTIGSGTWGAPHTQIKTKVGASYLVAAEFKNITTTSSRVRVLNIKDSTVKITSSDLFETSYLTFTASADEHRVELIVGDSAFDSTGDSVHIAGARVYEITATEKAYIDNLLTAEAQAYIDANYPYVDTMQSIRNPYVIASGGNLAKGLEYGSLNTSTGEEESDNAFVRSDYIRALPNTVYCMKDHDESATTCRFYFYDSNKSFISTTGDSNPSMTATSPEGTAYVRVRFGGVTVNNRLQLTVNSYADYVEPSETYKFFYGAQDEEDFVLRSNVNGSVADELNGDVITRRFGFKVLDGTLGWTYHSSGTGFKRVTVPLFGGMIPSAITKVMGVKYDGKPLTGAGSLAGSDQFAVTSTLIHFTIANTDSGWGQNYTPTSAEIKAYFNGWKMFVQGEEPGTSVYNGTGTKAWWNREVGGVTTVNLPTTANPDLERLGYSFYRIQYELAQPVTVKAFSEGDVIAHEGVNQITVGAGVVVREGLTLKAVGTFYQLNEPTRADTWTLYRPEDFYEIYKNNAPSINEWSYWQIGTAGRRMALDLNKYETSATYSATYFVLDKHLFGIPAPVDVVTSGTELDTIEFLVEYVAHLKREIDVLKRGE